MATDLLPIIKAALDNDDHVQALVDGFIGGADDDGRPGYIVFDVDMIYDNEQLDCVSSEAGSFAFSASSIVELWVEGETVWP